MHIVIFCWLMTYILHSWRIFCIGNSWRIFCIVPLSFDICRYHIQCRYQSHVPCDLIRYGAAGMNVSDYMSSHVTCVMSRECHVTWESFISHVSLLVVVPFVWLTPVHVWYTYIYINMMCVYTYIHICIYNHIMCTNIYMCVCICICMYMYIHT